MKRFRPRAKGSASQILKRTSHITVVVSEKKEVNQWVKKFIQLECVSESSVTGIKWYAEKEFRRILTRRFRNP